MTAPNTNALERRRLPFDPIEEAAKQWATQWGEMPRMRAVTSLMRVHQLLITELDELLRPLGLTFARYEVLVLLSFSRRGALPLGKIGERLQVHATSVTPLVKRLDLNRRPINFKFEMPDSKRFISIRCVGRQPVRWDFRPYKGDARRADIRVCAMTE